MTDKQLTVGVIIAHLQQYNPDWLVKISGFSDKTILGVIDPDTASETDIMTIVAEAKEPDND